MDLIQIPNLKISRLTPGFGCGEVTLHCFCDASAQAYAACVYLRSGNGGKFNNTLVFAKTRLAPKNVNSIPRLELMAVVIAVRSIKFVHREMRLPVSRLTIWSDSKCVLAWLTSTKHLSVFVENRLKEIKAEDGLHFRYINTTENPADIATRDITSSKDLSATVWWKGPTWLAVAESNWPTTMFVTPQDIVNSADQQTAGNDILYEVGLSSSDTPPGQSCTSPFDINESHYSSLSKLHRVTAWCFRFVKMLKGNCHKEYLANHLSAKEIAVAKQRWEEYIQSSNFSQNRNHLKQQLGIQIDNHGLMRCRGRFDNAGVSDEVKFPKLLPQKGHYTFLVIQKAHKDILHAGVSHTLSRVRQEFWIPRGRSVVRHTLLKCQVCRKWNGGPYKLPQMPPWPSSRVSQSSPFTYTGLDYFGPMFIKNTSEAYQKVWVCLFTCLTVRAVHLELVGDLSTDQFLLGLRRFVARRGKPTQIVCDNASQFKAAARTTDASWKSVFVESTVQSFLATQGIGWYFITEFAPWMGGFYERLIGIVKSSLRKAIGKVCLTMIQLQTVLIEVEAVANSRPLVYVGNDMESNTIITPSHFLTINPKCGFPTDSENSNGDPLYLPDSSAQKLTYSWLKGSKLLDQFWKLWVNDYLTSLRERSQTHIKQGRVQFLKPSQVGDIVLIKDDNLPRGSWRLGRIAKLLYSYDGNVRAAKLTLPQQKSLVRPLKLLYPIECPSGQELCNIDDVKERSELLGARRKSDVDASLDDATAPSEQLNQQRRTTRGAAEKARQEIRKILEQ